MSSFQILDWDSRLFGFKVAKILPAELTINEFESIIDETRSHKVKLAYWPTTPVFDLQEKFSEKFNGSLVDVKTTYSKRLFLKNDYDFPDDPMISFYSRSSPDTDLYNIALQCGEYSRFKIDPMISSSVYQKLYTTWIEKCVSKELADEVIIYKKDGKIAGLITALVRNSIGEIGLVGVDEHFRGQQIANHLMKASDQYFVKAGCATIKVVTQGKNHIACSLYEKNGFTVQSQTHFYHFWL